MSKTVGKRQTLQPKEDETVAILEGDDVAAGIAPSGRQLRFRRQAEDAEAKFLELFDSAPASISIADGARRIAFISR